MKQILKRMTMTAALLGVGVLILGLFFVQPLIPSGAYKVSATLEGRPIKTELLNPVFIPGLYYVHLPESQPNRYHWFGVAFSRKSVFSPIGIRTGWWGFRYIHTDQANGVNLTDGKMEDSWKVTYTSGGVRFSNHALEISLTP